MNTSNDKLPDSPTAPEVVPETTELNRPPVGSKVRMFPEGAVLEVTGHTTRGFTYKGGVPICIPRMGIQGDGTGECYLDVAGCSWAFATDPASRAPVNETGTPRSNAIELQVGKWLARYAGHSFTLPEVANQIHEEFEAVRQLERELNAKEREEKERLRKAIYATTKTEGDGQIDDAIALANPRAILAEQKENKP